MYKQVIYPYSVKERTRELCEKGELGLTSEAGKMNEFCKVSKMKEFDKMQETDSLCS